MQPRPITGRADTGPWVPPDSNSRVTPEEWANNLPITSMLNMTCSSLGSTEATFRVSTPPLVVNPNGSVHGGMLTAIADQAMSILAVWSAPRGTLAVTGSLHAQFHRPAMTPLMLRARLLKGGKRASFVELEIDDKDGRRCATCQVTMIVDDAGVPQHGRQQLDDQRVGDPSVLDSF